eukprot:4134359-Pyramimonas_sp.AAC.2
MHLRSFLNARCRCLSDVVAVTGLASHSPALHPNPGVALAPPLPPGAHWRPRRRSPPAGERNRPRPRPVTWASSAKWRGARPWPCSTGTSSMRNRGPRSHSRQCPPPWPRRPRAPTNKQAAHVRRVIFSAPVRTPSGPPLAYLWPPSGPPMAPLCPPSCPPMAP